MTQLPEDELWTIPDNFVVGTTVLELGNKKNSTGLYSETKTTTRTGGFYRWRGGCQGRWRGGCQGRWRERVDSRAGRP